ncbi:hypothetical protein HHK36_021403 [Tetracentron sinense]|uniref:adenine phosphoribosyltransferase n=1 Tax=Tetracentron sinense TaxID=13715 RepID=A0A834YRF3_TETSI|nr:hypothetical protein HHK36_021403 [Tetracentron sinense]
MLNNLHAGLVDEGRRWFDLMGPAFGVLAKIEHYSCMVDLLARAGHINEAWEFIEKMPEKPDAVVLGALLGACRNLRNVEIGENGLKGDPRLQAISESIRVVPHFPKQGIMFQDITTMLLDHKVFKDAVDIFVDRYRDMGVEARGFMFGPSIALAIGAKFVPLRKPRKLPGEVISEAYVLEYGTDCLEMHVGAVQPGERALVIDDLVATGGTLSAAIRLLVIYGSTMPGDVICSNSAKFEAVGHGVL